jgi:hypothetical protein
MFQSILKHGPKYKLMNCLEDCVAGELILTTMNIYCWIDSGCYNPRIIPKNSMILIIGNEPLYSGTMLKAMCSSGIRYIHGAHTEFIKM